jgi:predicted nucleic acid-binding Zn ribbon protein
MADCIVCGGPLPEGGRSDRIYCSKVCGNRSRNKTYYRHNKSKIEAYRELQRNTQLERSILSRVKHRAKRDGIPFNLEVSDIVVPDTCPILGIPLTAHYGKGVGYHPDSPSVDRIIPSQGYTKGNVRVISARANLLKNDATVAELEKVLEDLRRIEHGRNPSNGL